jgi:hypothetical protein
MSRTYSEALRIAVGRSDSESAGIALARACIAANLPSIAVAQALGVSRVTLHNWFRGGRVRYKNVLKVDVLTDIIESDMKKGILPAKSVLEAKSYLEDLTRTTDSPAE